MNADVERAMNWLKGMADDRGYTEHLAYGGKGDPIKEQEIECASTALKYIESLQAKLDERNKECGTQYELLAEKNQQLAASQRRERAAVEDLRCACWNDDELCGGKLCVYCAKFNKFDAKKPWPCDKPCKDACEWQWRGDAEEDADRAIAGLDEVLPPKGRVRDERD